MFKPILIVLDLTGDFWMLGVGQVSVDFKSPFVALPENKHVRMVPLLISLDVLIYL